jgi:hypothetical protein
MTGSTFVGRVEELIRLADALEKDGDSERSQALATRLRSTVLRPLIELRDGLLRQYFPKGTDLSRYSNDELEAVAAALNSRPRKTLGWKTPAEALRNHLSSVKRTRVATAL